MTVSLTRSSARGLNFSQTYNYFLPRDAIASSVALAVRHAVCVRLSVTFVHSVKTNKHLFKIFSPSDSHTILVFHTKRHGNIPTGTPLTGVSNAGAVC